MSLCVLFDLDLCGMTLGQGHDTTLGHVHQLSDVLSRSTMALRSYGLTLGQGHDTPLGHGQQLCEMAVRSYGPDTDGTATPTAHIDPVFSLRFWRIWG